MQWPAVSPLVRPKCLNCGHQCSSKGCKKWSRNPTPVLSSSSLARQHSEPEQDVSTQRSESSGDGDRVVDHVSFKDGRAMHRRGAGKSFRGCLFFPGLSHKKKHATQLANTTQAPPEANQDAQEPCDEDERVSSAWRAASLERFECESWSSSAILDGDDGGVQSFFDLPLELVRNGNSGENSPVKAAFVFESDRKGPLTKSTSTLAPRKSHELSSRQMRFSTSPVSYPASPSSAFSSPGMQKAIEEFHAFLEARNA